jgi:hypothetical protein
VHKAGKILFTIQSPYFISHTSRWTSVFSVYYTLLSYWMARFGYARKMAWTTQNDLLQTRHVTPRSRAPLPKPLYHKNSSTSIAPKRLFPRARHWSLSLATDPQTPSPRIHGKQLYLSPFWSQGVGRGSCTLEMPCGGPTFPTG